MGMSECGHAHKTPVFRGETKRLRGWYCPICKEFVKPVGREGLYTIESYKKFQTTTLGEKYEH
jgi:hypothetical protein